MRGVEELTPSEAQGIRGEILQWEREFALTHGRRPTKEDLRAVDEGGGDDARRSSRIYEFYVLYAQWKKKQQGQGTGAGGGGRAAPAASAAEAGALAPSTARATAPSVLASSSSSALPKDPRQKRPTLRQRWQQKSAQEAEARRWRQQQQQAALAGAGQPGGGDDGDDGPRVVLCSPEKPAAARGDGKARAGYGDQENRQEQREEEEHAAGAESHLSGRSHGLSRPLGKGGGLSLATAMAELKTTKRPSASASHPFVASGAATAAASRPSSSLLSASLSSSSSMSTGLGGGGAGKAPVKRAFGLGAKAPTASSSWSSSSWSISSSSTFGSRTIRPPLTSTSRGLNADTGPAAADGEEDGNAVELPTSLAGYKYRPTGGVSSQARASSASASAASLPPPRRAPAAPAPAPGAASQSQQRRGFLARGGEWRERVSALAEIERAEVTAAAAKEEPEQEDGRGDLGLDALSSRRRPSASPPASPTPQEEGEGRKGGPAAAAAARRREEASDEDEGSGSEDERPRAKKKGESRGGGASSSARAPSLLSRPAPAASMAASASDAAVDAGAGAEKAKAGGPRRKEKLLKKGEISDNYIALNLKRKGSSRFRRVKSAKAITRRQAWVEQRFSDKIGGGRNGNGASGGGGGRRKAGPPRAPVDPLDVCLDVLSGFAQADLAGAEEALMQKALAEVRKCRAGSVKEIRDPVLKALAPKCAHHRQSARLLKVKKAGPNKGRRFYACSFPRGEGCSFFMWVEDNPVLVAAEIGLGTGDEAADGGGEEWSQRQVEAWKARFHKMTVPELKAEARKRGLALSGTKAVLVERLLEGLDETVSGLAACGAGQGAGAGRAEVSEASEAESASSSEGGSEDEDEDDDEAEGGEEDGWELDIVGAGGAAAAAAAGEPDEAGSESDGSAMAVEEKEAPAPREEEAPESSSDGDWSSEDGEAAARRGRKRRRLGRGRHVEQESSSSSPSSSSDEDSSSSSDEDGKADQGKDSSSKGKGKRKSAAAAKPVVTGRGITIGGPMPMLQPGEALSDKKAQEALGALFGYKDFRAGQLWAIRRALAGERSLLMLPTGGGKTLAYQMAAALAPKGSLTVVVSPLISLMQDQLGRLPPQIPGACLAGNLSMREMARIVRDLRSGRLRVLFLSPEKLCSPSFRRLVQGEPGGAFGAGGAFPPVSLVCVDEAHCLSHWSHNFRPAFLRLGRNVDSLLRPRALLAMTATADPDVVQDIRAHLRIPSESDGGVLLQPWRRPNLRLRVELVDGGDQAKRARVAAQLAEAPHDKGAAIVYVRQQRDADTLRDFLQAQGQPAVAYHAGMDLKQRAVAQQAWMRSSGTGRARVCVATVAFGLGVDKGDVRSVLHYEMPKSVENLVQETGRAGRDGQEAWCPTLLAREDFLRQHSLAHSDGITALQLRGLLETLAAAAGAAASTKPKGEEGGAAGEEQAEEPEGRGVQLAIDAKGTALALDVKEEVLETALVLLELPPFSLLTLHGSLQDDVRVVFRKRPASTLRRTEAVVDALLTVGTPSPDLFEKGADVGSSSSAPDPSTSRFGTTYGYGSARVSLVRLAAALGPSWTPHDAAKQLLRLQAAGEIEFSSATPETRQHYHITLLGSGGAVLPPSVVDAVVAQFAATMQAVEAASVKKVEQAYAVLRTAAGESEGEAQEQRALALIDDYFARREVTLPASIPAPFRPIPAHVRAALKQDAATLMLDPRLVLLLQQVVSRARRPANRGGQAGTIEAELRAYKARLAARLFHGVGSPRLSVGEWRESPFWNKYRDWRFEEVEAILVEK